MKKKRSRSKKPTASPPFATSRNPTATKKILTITNPPKMAYCPPRTVTPPSSQTVNSKEKAKKSKAVAVQTVQHRSTETDSNPTKNLWSRTDQCLRMKNAIKVGPGRGLGTRAEKGGINRGLSLGQGQGQGIENLRSIENVRKMIRIRVMVKVVKVMMGLRVRMRLRLGGRR